ncbi:MAG: hypothetical protein M3R65_00890 [Gemmatimonadota bacterium]|nr:hypothetical protein [Gemmatimonadota bacterium]
MHRFLVSLVGVALASTVGGQRTLSSSAGSPVVPAAERTILISASDFAYTGLPQHAPAGWLRVTMANSGKELHMLATFSVPRGYTQATLIDSLIHGHAPANFEEWGGPNAVAPGDTNTMYVMLPAGPYVVGCFVRSADGTTHFMKGMLGTFDVVATANTGAPPPSDRNVTIGGTTSLHTGEHAFVTANFTPGTYVLVCWLTTHNKFHFDLGMKNVFTVSDT